MTADDQSPDGLDLEGLDVGGRRSGLFSPHDGARGAEELSPPSVGALRDVLMQIESAIDLGVVGDDLEYFVHDVCARCFPARTPSLSMAGALPAPRLSRAAAELHGISDAMLEESGVELIERYAPRFDAALFGFDVPVQSEGRLLGVLSLEYEGENSAVAEDRDAVSLIAFSIGSAVARAKAIDENTKLLDQLRHMQKLASVGQLTASIAHELNHPLTSVSVYAELLHKRAETTGRDDWETVRLARILSAAERMQGLTRDLVEYARPTPRERAYEDVAQLIARALSIGEPAVARSNAVVEVQIAEEMPPLFCIGSQIEQVLVNLVTNATHAVTQDGSGRVRVRADEQLPYVRILVEDNGSGISPAHRRSIFEPFFSTKGKGEGSGLGLSIVRRIVEEHDGTIAVIDGELGGATLEVRLPSMRR